MIRPIKAVTSAINTIATCAVLGSLTFIFWLDHLIEELSLEFVATVFLILFGLDNLAKRLKTIAVRKGKQC